MVTLRQNAYLPGFVKTLVTSGIRMSVGHSEASAGG